ncbi:MAG: hypothetical protein H7Y04_00095 [Verrucomicrobia bacterium]|nr:hypothetical protein [Cytophagales bacterium]
MDCNHSYFETNIDKIALAGTVFLSLFNRIFNSLTKTIMKLIKIFFFLGLITLSHAIFAQTTEETQKANRQKMEVRTDSLRSQAKFEEKKAKEAKRMRKEAQSQEKQQKRITNAEKDVAKESSRTLDAMSDVEKAQKRTEKAKKKAEKEQRKLNKEVGKAD